MKSTIQEIFLENVKSDNGTGITFIDERNSTDHLSYKKLYLEACYKLHALREKGLNPGDELIFQFESNRNFVITFWACVLGKIIPVPVAFVAGSNTIKKICGIWKRLNNPFIITDNPTLKANFTEFQNHEDAVFGEMLERFLVFDELKNSKKATPLPADESDIVFIQFSSGSTGAPKGITNTQEAILYNYQDYLANIGINKEDRFLGWVPLIHDMGLIFFHLVPLLSNVPQHLMLPTLFVAYPELWMEKMSEYKITISGSPNFGYRLVLDNFDRIELKHLSLDSVRLLINSAEPVSIEDCTRFSDAFASHGLPEHCVKAAYGLADAVLGVSMNYKEKDKEYFLNRSKLNIGNAVEIAKNKSGDVISFANLGTYGFTQITIVDENNQVLPDGTLGFIRLKSTAVTKGYYNDPETTQKIISEDGWLNTGDIGFLDNKDLIMTGRAKEMFIINGQNYFPNDLDYVLSEMSEINFQQAVCCSIFNESTNTDEVFVFVLFKDKTEDFKILANEIRQHISDRLGLQLSKVIPVGQIPKTTSGKIQRYLLRDRYLNGDYNQLLEGLDDVDEDVNTDLYTPPTTEIEHKLVKIWQTYFDLEKIGIEANFYFLGGNSIGMGRLAMKIEEEFGISLDIRKLFTCVSFEDQVKLIENSIERPFNITEKTPIKLNYPLFTTQKRLFALYESDTQSIAYNTPVVIEIKGSLNIKLCEDVFREIIQRHEILRTSFDIFDGKPMQQIHDDFDFEIEIIDDGDSLELVKRHIRPFNLSAPPLLRVLVCKEGDVYTKIILDVHHIVVDGASFEILIGEFNQLYSKESIEPLRFQYRDFIAWNEEKFKGLNLEIQKEFWMNQYAETVEPINLPTDVYKEEKKKIYDGDTVIFDLNDGDEKELRKLCKKEKVTMSTMTLAVFNILLSKLTNSDDIVIGTSSLGRWKKEFKDLIGLFIDTLPIRSNPSRDLAFSEFLQKVNSNVSNCIKNGEFSFEDLYKELKLEKNSNSNSLFNIAFEYYNFNWSNVAFSGLHLLNSDQVNVVSKFPLVLRVIEKEQGCKLHLDYSLNSFSRETIERFGNYYLEIVKTIVEDNSVLLKDIQILSDIEVDQQLNEFNDTSSAYEKDTTIIEKFSSQVKSNPDKIALVFEKERWTYSELDKRSTQLARYINKKNKTKSSLIGLCMDRSIDMIIGALGILKSGSGYVPVDVSYPTSRIAHIIEDSNLKLVVTERTYSEPFENIEKVLWDTDKNLIDKESTRKISSKVNSNDLAYVMYTSGSAEKPKGVLINHQNVVSSVKENGAPSLKTTDRVLQWSNVTYDGAVSDIFCSLLNGATLYLIDKQSTSDLKNLSTLIKENEISVALFPTAIFNAFVDTEIEGLESLRRLHFGGERASLQHVQKAYDVLGPGKMINCYGLTENTVHATYYPINERPKQNVPIGKPVSNTKTYVLDSSNNLCGIGITGELHIGGDRLSIGYLGGEEKTDSQFIDNPFEPGSRLFKTGDLVKWLPDGNLEFVGRADDQVKLEGFRIALSDIAWKLDTFKAVDDSVVLVKEIEGKEYIVAYYKSKDTIENSRLRDHLSEHLPEYMLPSLFVHLKELPLTSNGKVNRKILPEPTRIEEKGYLAPNSEIEHKLVAIWADVLNMDAEVISVNGSFFDYGGYSLNVLFLISRINKEFDIKISPSDIIANPTIVDMQNFISTSSNVDHVSIPVAEARTHYPLSSSQKRMYYSYEYDKDSIGYNVPIIATLNGILDKEKLKSVLTRLIQRHENLRTIFEFCEGELVQRILPEIVFDIHTLEKGEDLNGILKRFVKPFNLSESPLFRVGLKGISNTEHILIIDTHHIVSDGITNAILLKELILLYNGENLPENRIQYKDFVIWQQGEEHQKEIAKHKEYWLERFSKETTTLELPYDYPRPKEFNVLGKNHTIELDRDYVDRLKNITQSEGVTMYTLVLALYNLLLYKLSNQKDIVIGTSVAGRSHIDLETVAGVFINTLALRNNPEGNLTFKEFLQQVQQNNLQDLEHQLYPYDDLVDALNVERVSGRNTLFDTFLAYHSINDDTISNTSELQAKLFEDLFPQAQFDLIFTILNFEDKLKLNFTYRDELFKDETVVRFMSYFKRIINQVLINDTILIDEINILSQEEEDQQLNEFNDTELHFDKESSLVSILQENVAKHPDRIAISYEGETLTYKELDDRSNKVANYLISEGVTPNVVGLLIDRSSDMIVGMWGALKVGAGYLPLDPTLPEDRIRYMLDQSGATFLLTRERHLEAYSAYLPVQSIDSSKIRSQSTERITFKTEPTDLAYCIFTSGSTGKPKGVMINHSNVINLVKGLEERVYKPYQDKVLRVALLASYAFDASVQQIFGALLQGHSLYVTDDDTRKNGTKLKSFFDDNKIDVSDGTPTHLRILVDAEDSRGKLKSLSSWLLAGEVLSKDLISTFYKRFGEKTQLYNFYGPTETCVDSTSFKIDLKQVDNLRTIPIGKPLANERVYVTDDNGALVPIGVIGELCIAGDGLAQRYVGDQSLTTEKFNADWISQENRVYRTGDMVRWLPDGNLEFHGRKDNQVKIRGYRIELGEIQKQLNTHPDIKHSVILIKESMNEKYLVAYYQASDKMKISELRDYLGKFLPDYMIPSYYMHVEEFGLTVNGKVDYKALPDYKIVQEDQDVIAPSNDMERKLAVIYAEVLNLDSNNIGSNSNFMELGGHSLKMVYLANSIEKELSVKVSLKQIIENPTVNRLSDLISQSATIIHSQIPVAESREYYPLSSAQKRMYFAHEYDKESLSYNVPIAFTLKGILDKEKLEESFVKLINRHDSLRTQFVLVDGALSQRILPEVDFSINYLNNDKDFDRIIKSFTKPFDLSSAPSLRVGIVEVSNQEHVLIMDCHHIISDEVTNAIILKDFSAIYNGENLPELRIQYKDFVMWQNEELQQEEIKKHKKYWLDKFSNNAPTLELPYDYPRSARNSDQGGNLLVKLDHSKVERLKKIALSEGLTLYNLFLSMYNILLYKLSNQKDIVVGTPVAGRPHHDLESITGTFINTLPIRNQIQGDMTFEEFVQQVQKDSATDLDHQLYPYQDMVDELHLERDLNRNPLFDVSFNFMKQDLDMMNLSGFDIEPYNIKYNQSKFDLTMIVVEREEDNYMLIEYAKQLFKENTVERFMSYFDNIIEAICKDKTVKIADIEILEEKENQLLNSFSPMVNSNQEENTIVSTFERQVKVTPMATAIKYGSVSYTFDDLNQKVNQLARSLQQEYDISRGDIVGVLLPKSDAAVISILAILKLGAAYLPIDTGYPIERINYIIENSGLSVLITNENSYSSEISVDCHVPYEKVVLGQEKTNLNVNISSNDLAYVIYTSGSTGKPKGVMIEHGSNVNMSTDIVKQLNVNDRDTILWFASIGFDASVYEIMMALYSGATLVIPEDGVINDTTRFCSLLSESRTTIVTLPPSYLETLPLEKLNSLRIITTAGESANTKKAIEVIKSGIRYFNAYGPTECAVCVSTYEVFRDDEGLTNIPIGKPIANTEMVILDNDLKQVAIGVKGTIYVAGEGVARGYLNNPVLTEKSFVTLPNGDTKKYYNTGDLGEWTSNGLVIFHGRKDNQIKLRGYRIELGEIEGTLSSIDYVGHCHVTLREGPAGEKELIGFVILDGTLDKASIEQDLGKLLPEYMVPKSWMQLGEFPLTINGKIDTKALLQLEVEGTDQYVAPSNNVEKRLVQIWSEILHIDKDEIGVLDDFFDHGGNSLLAIQLLTAINKNYGIQLELQEVFRLKTIRGLSELIDLELWVNDEEKKDIEYSETVI